VGLVDGSFLGTFQSAFKSNEVVRGLAANGEIPVDIDCTGVEREVSMGEGTGSAAFTIEGRFGGEELVTPAAVSWSSSIFIKSAKFSSGSAKDDGSADKGEAFVNNGALDVAGEAASSGGDIA
jgi:hypothetical protein